MRPEELTNAQIDQVIAALMAEKVERLLDAEDPSALLDLAMERLFVDDIFEPEPALISPNVLAIPGVIRDTTGDTHKCCLETIKVADENTERWAWDSETETFLDSAMVRHDKRRRSVSLHAALNGMVIGRHTQTFDGRSHERKKARGWRVITRPDGYQLVPHHGYTPGIIARMNDENY